MQICCMWESDKKTMSNQENVVENCRKNEKLFNFSFPSMFSNAYYTEEAPEVFAWSNPPWPSGEQMILKCLPS